MGCGEANKPIIGCNALNYVQKDGFNCDVFVCWFMEQLLVSWPGEPRLSLEFNADVERNRIRERLEEAYGI